MTKKINWIFLVAGTLIMMFVMMRTGRSLKTPATPMGIINLELALNAFNADNVIGAWNQPVAGSQSNIQVAIKNTWLDFIFLFFYSLFLFYCCKSIAESFSGFTARTGIFLAIGALNAGLLDIAENTGMLFMLNGISSNSIALLTTVCSAIKWVLALGALFYVVLLAPLYLIRNWNKKER